MSVTEPPLGAVITHWLRPREDRAHIHRIEVEHALYLAAASQEQIKTALTGLLHGQTRSLENISLSIDKLRDEVAAGFGRMAEGLSELSTTLQQGLYQLHLNDLGTHARLDDLLLLTYDRAGYQRELAARSAAARARNDLFEASSDYSHAMKLTQRALNESIAPKAGAMLDEAIAVFGRACLHTQFAPEAHFQLGYLAQQHRHDVDSAYEHYEKALGPSYSPHFVRTSRHLAHLDYLTGRYDRALERLQDLVDHDDAIMGFAHDLQSASQLGWEDDACIRGLEGALKRNAPLLQRCARLSHVRGQFDNHRRFSATEGFLESYPVLKKELLALRPDGRVYYDAARYAIKAGRSSLAVPWLKRCHDAQTTLNARRAFLIEAMADEDLRNG